MSTLRERLANKFIQWMMKKHHQRDFPLSDFDRLRYEIRPCDVLLVEGVSRISDIIRVTTQSPWTHSMLYIGRMHDVENPLLRQRIREAYHGDESEQLVIESLLGKGTIITPLSFYQDMHMRICRPKGISRQDAHNVIAYAIGGLGREYDVRQILDLARLLIPWGILPRRWRSSLFQYKPNETTRQICSTLLAEAFASVHFPILPILHRREDKRLELITRNPRLYAPKDFDYSPFFEIIKYPFFSLSEDGMYRHLPWSQDAVSNDEQGIVQIDEKTQALLYPSAATQEDIKASAPKVTPETSAATPIVTASTESGVEPKVRRHWFQRKKITKDKVP